MRGLMTRTAVAAVILMVTVFVSGCRMGSFPAIFSTAATVLSAVAPKEVQDETTREFQERYGTSPYYDQKVNGLSMRSLVDPPSGFQRQKGAIVIYNQTGSTINIQWVGDLSSGERNVQALSDWKVNADLDVTLKDTGNQIGTLRIDKYQDGRIYVVRPGFVEIR